MSRVVLPGEVGLALVGYRGTGKSTIGRLTAGLLGRQFLDADAVLEARLGRSIRSIFEADGEVVFRDEEEAVLADLTSKYRQTVLATGGGAVLRPANREALRRFGHVVWLRADPAVLAGRLRHDSDRPALTAAGTLAEIADVLAAREPLYREVAATVIETDGRSPPEVARLILAALVPVRRGRPGTIGNGG